MNFEAIKESSVTAQEEDLTTQNSLIKDNDQPTVPTTPIEDKIRISHVLTNPFNEAKNLIKSNSSYNLSHRLFNLN